MLTSRLLAAEIGSGAKPLEVQSVVLRLIDEADVPAQEAGVLTSVAVHEGDRVKKGATLARIDDQVAVMAELAARLKFDVAHEKAANDVQVRYARKAAEVAAAEYKRSTESVARFAKSVSDSQVDVDRLNAEKTQLEAEQADHNQQIATLEMKSAQNELDAAKVQRLRRQIVAPFDGTIVQVFVRLGEWVEPGQKALRIVNINHLKAEGFLPASAADASLVGAPVRLTLDLAGEQSAAFDGKVSFVSPEVDPITGQVRVWAEIDNHAGRLRPGQPVRMAIERRPPAVVSSQ